jgi:hypothetical protein
MPHGSKKRSKSKAGKHTGTSSAPKSTSRKKSSSSQLKPSVLTSVSLKAAPLKHSEMKFLATSLLTAYLLSSLAPGLRKKLVDDNGPKYVPFKLQLGNDETVYVLRPNDSVHKVLKILENLPLHEKCSMATQSFVEIKPSHMAQGPSGSGLFVTKDVLPGELIISERPMVSHYIFHGLALSALLDWLASQLVSDHVCQKDETGHSDEAALALHDELIDQCLSPTDKARFLSLPTKHPKLRQTCNILRTNGHIITFDSNRLDSPLLWYWHFRFAVLRVLS